MPAEPSTVAGMAPSAVRLRVLHVSGRGTDAEAGRMAAAERALGWTARTGGLPAALRPADADVVVLHGRAAGLLGRLLLRGRCTTVLAPGRDGWAASAGFPALLAERLAGRWANAVLVSSADEAAAGVRRGLWVPPFVVGGSTELAAAVLTRAHAFGRPSSRPVGSGTP